MKQEIPRLASGEIDYDKIDEEDLYWIHETLPELYPDCESIENFIAARNLSFPTLQNLLKLRKEKNLDLTPTESSFIFDSMFWYIRSVFKDKREKTNREVEKWLGYIENHLVMSGLEYFRKDCYASITHVEGRIYNSEIINRFDKIVVDGKEITGDENTFFIRTDRRSILPYRADDGECYAAVFVKEDHVYIAGCDDFSWTLETGSREKSEDFAAFLMRAAPVWNFEYSNLIDYDLKFTN